MKRRKKNIARLLLTIGLIFCLTGCGGSGDGKGSENSTGADSLVSGKTYSFESYTVDGENSTESMTAMYKEQTLTFEEDGTCVQTIIWADEMAEELGMTEPVEQNGTYTESGSTVTATFASDEEDLVMEFTAEDDTLTMDEDGYVTVYRVTAAD